MVTHIQTEMQHDDTAQYTVLGWVKIHNYGVLLSVSHVKWTNRLSLVCV